MPFRDARTPRRWRLGLAALHFALLTTALSPPARAAELAAFVSGASPSELWGSGYGGSLGITLFTVLGLELEGAKQGGQTAASDMWSVSGRAYVSPTLGRLVPYVGLSTGFYRQSLGTRHDTGSLSGVFVGLKVKFPLGVLVKAEYQRVRLPDEALIKMDGRYLGGVGFSF